MDFNREWTQFAADAEVEHHGTARLCKAHNRLREEFLKLATAQENAEEKNAHSD
jgi:hypothetical protein